MNDQGSDPRIAQAAEAIRSADALLIGAGAGLSAAAGYDFTSEERFARDYPGMLQYGTSLQRSKHLCSRIPSQTNPETAKWRINLSSFCL